MASTKSGWGRVYWSHTKKNGPVLLQNVASTALDTQASGCFIGGARKERRCFAAECGPDPFEHTRALEGPFFDPNPWARTSALAFIGATRKDRPCFAAERGLDRLGHTSLRMVYWRHTKGTALFCCRRRGPDPLEHTRALEGPFFDPNPPRAGTTALAFIGATRKERPCFAAERGLDRLGHTSLRMVYWRHTKGTALFCCRMRPRPLWAHTSTLGEKGG